MFYQPCCRGPVVNIITRPTIIVPSNGRIDKSSCYDSSHDCIVKYKSRIKSTVINGTWSWNWVLNRPIKVRIIDLKFTCKIIWVKENSERVGVWIARGTFFTILMIQTATDIFFNFVSSVYLYILSSPTCI